MAFALHFQFNKMRGFQVCGAAILWCFGFAACSGSDNPRLSVTPAPSGAEEAAQWTVLDYRATCAELSSAQCPGAAGMHFKPDGSYTAGPADDGMFVTGFVTASERDQLNSSANAVAQTGFFAAGQCTPQAASALAGTEVMELSLMDSARKVRFFERNSATAQSCTFGTATSSASLQSFVSALVASYYPIPFPSSSR